jgi:hypothetical protein
LLVGRCPTSTGAELARGRRARDAASRDQRWRARCCVLPRAMANRILPGALFAIVALLPRWVSCAGLGAIYSRGD